MAEPTGKTEQTYWESIKAEGGAAFDKLKDLIHEGNVRRVRIRQSGEIVAEFPLNAGIIGAVFAPVLAAIGAIVALLKNCSIEVEKVEKPVATEERGTPAA